MNKKMLLGPEYDAALRNALMAALKAAGAKPLQSNWGVAGSQEFETLMFELDEALILVEIETYIGLSISGDEGKVSRIVSLLPRGPVGSVE